MFLCCLYIGSLTYAIDFGQNFECVKFGGRERISELVSDN